MAKRAYKMEISVLVDDSQRQRLIDTARELYARSGSVSRIEDDGTEVQLTPEEFIETVDDALIELLHQHPGFEQAGIEIARLVAMPRSNMIQGSLTRIPQTAHPRSFKRMTRRKRPMSSTSSKPVSISAGGRMEMLRWLLHLAGERQSFVWMSGVALTEVSSFRSTHLWRIFH